MANTLAIFKVFYVFYRKSIGRIDYLCLCLLAFDSYICFIEKD